LILNKLSEDDKKVYQQMQAARRSGNAELSDQLRAELAKKYPDVKF
jgi:hypothetical protein